MKRNDRKAKARLCGLLLIGLLFCAGCQNPPPAPEAAFRMLFFSDTQADPATGDYQPFGALLAQAVSQAEGAEWLLLGGDSVNDGGAAEEWQAWREAAEPALAGLMVAAAAGNHDQHRLLAEQQFAYPTSAPEPVEAGFFYYFNTPQAFVLVLDSNRLGAGDAADLAWVEAALQSEDAEKASWRLVMMHHPLWPVADIAKDQQRAAVLQEHLPDLFAASGVDLLLCGHQHLYARLEPATGPPQLMVASGGKDSYTPSQQPGLLYSTATPNYLLLELQPERLLATAYDQDGAVLDQLLLTR